MRTIHRRVPHLLRVAVVGAHDGTTAAGRQRLEQFPHPAIRRLDGTGSRGQRARVPHHVGVGVIHDDQPVLAAQDRLLRGARHVGGRHLRLQIVGRDLRARRARAILARERILAVIIEEERHVRVLFGLGAAELRDARLAHHFA